MGLNNNFLVWLRPLLKNIRFIDIWTLGQVNLWLKFIITAKKIAYFFFEYNEDKYTVLFTPNCNFPTK